MLPRFHAGQLFDMTGAQMGELARLFQETMARVEVCLGDPPFNYAIHTAPTAPTQRQRECYHWHIELIPRVTRLAGFEWGTGFYINPVEPEAAARYLRDVPARQLAQKIAGLAPPTADANSTRELTTMQIVMVASEVAPFSKEGGLADVLGALPRALGELGEDVCVISPLYRNVRANAEKAGLALEPVEDGTFSVPIGDARVGGRVWRSALPESNVTALFLQNDRYYDRDGYYTRGANNADYQDNSERFVFLARGALEWCRQSGLRPDVIHCHDWHSGLLPVYVKHVYRGDFPDTATVFTIHNLAYQGLFWHWDMNLAGLPWRLFNWHMLEFYGKLSFLKAGLVGADVLTTVSPTYAREIQTEQNGAGMHGVLQERSDDLYGIVNGIDEREWGPAADPLVPAAYSAEDLSGKADCRAALQTRFGLPHKAGVPVVAHGGAPGRVQGAGPAEGGTAGAAGRGAAVRADGHGRAARPGVPQRAARAARRPHGRHVQVHPGAGPPARGGQRHLPGAQPLRALRNEPALQHEVRHRARGARHRRAGGHGERLHAAGPGGWEGDGVRLPGVQRGGPAGGAAARAGPLRAAGAVAPAHAQRHAPGLVMGPERARIPEGIPKSPGEAGR